MKRLLTVTILLFASLLYSQSKFDINNLIDRGGLKYAPNDDEPYTGKVFDFYDNKGLKKLDGRYRKGLMNGKWTYYHENGKIMSKGNYKNGDGSYPDRFADEYKKEYPPYGGRNGKWTRWHENGQKELEWTYKDGKGNGLMISWYENGQKKSEGTFKDGKVNGLLTNWYENGQKKVEVTFKDGEFISSKCWDEDGNECECPENWWEGCK